MKFNLEQKALRRCIIEISHQHNLSHLGSCLSAVDIIAEIYKIKQRNERFVLSCGHAGVALYVVLGKFGFLKSSDIGHLHIHPDRVRGKGIDVSTGSLGQGLPIALGMALADKKKNVYCLISDGECAEGSIWEALRVGAEQKLENLKIILNANGWGAYDPVSLAALLKKIKGFGYQVNKVDGHNPSQLSAALKTKPSQQPLMIFAKTNVEQFPFLKGQDAHYHVMTADEYQIAKELLAPLNN